MSRFTLGLLGTFETRATPRLVPLRLPAKALALLAVLAVRPGQPHSRHKLAGLLWPDVSADQAHHSLRQALMSLRRTLCASHWPAVILAEGDTLAFDSTDVEVDVDAFEKCLAQGDWEALARAVTLYRGDFLEGFALDEASFEDWSVGERERLRELAVEALARLLQHYQQRSSECGAAIQIALRLLRLDRTQEVVHRTLIRLYTRQGRRAEALRQYRRCVSTLREDLGVDPEPETVRLHHEILRLRPVPPSVPERAAADHSAAGPTS